MLLFGRMLILINWESQTAISKKILMILKTPHLKPHTSLYNMPSSNFASSVSKSMVHGGSKVSSISALLMPSTSSTFSFTSRGRLSATGQFGLDDVLGHHGVAGAANHHHKVSLRRKSEHNTKARPQGMTEITSQANTSSDLMVFTRLPRPL